MSAFLALVARELALALRHGADTVAAILFFVLAGALFPLALGPSPELLRRMAPGILWVLALLASLLPLDRMFGAELEDGSLDLLLLSGLPPYSVAAGKAVAHWLTTGLPLIVAAIPLAEMLGLAPRAFPVLALALGLGTVILSLLGTMGSAIVLGARRGGVLLPLLILPLASPVLIFGAAATDAAANGLATRGPLLLLGALVALALPLCPLAGGAALRAAAE